MCRVPVVVSEGRICGVAHEAAICSISEAQHQLALHLKLVFVKKLRENPPDSFPDVRFSFPLGILRSFDQIGSR